MRAGSCARRRAETTRCQHRTRPQVLPKHAVERVPSGSQAPLRLPPALPAAPPGAGVRPQRHAPARGPGPARALAPRGDGAAPRAETVDASMLSSRVDRRRARGDAIDAAVCRRCGSRARPRVSARSCVIYTRLNTHTHVSDTNTSSVILTWSKTYTQCVHECDKTTRPGERRRPTAVRPRAPSRDARRDRRASTTRATPKI